MRISRVYIDTSVLGAVFDVEFRIPTITFFNQARSGHFNIVVSSLLEDEIQEAPHNVRNFYSDILEFAEIITPTREAIILQQVYLNTGIITPKWSDDALHVATATVFECDMIVSWNFKHIVHYEKKNKYNAANILNGYNQIEIFTPAEVIRYEEDL
ncbi:MAG: type II toxin-antitoxin system VapC family toxin [Armatimonadota bacterium]